MTRKAARLRIPTTQCETGGLVPVAYRWRFESPAHFAQAFRAEFGCAPRDVRARATTPPGEPVQAESWTDFYDWVLKLAA